MNSEIQITNDDELAQFLYLVDNFHDTIIKECKINSIGYVDQAYNMYGDTERYNVHIFMQSQFCDIHGIEIKFKQVTKFSLPCITFFSPEGKIEGGRILFNFFKKAELSNKDEQHNHYDIIADYMYYRLLDSNCLGSDKGIHSLSK
jgi:hypothetical protein